MKLLVGLCGILLLPLGEATAADAPTVRAARELAGTSSYKRSPSALDRKNHRFDCSTFVQEALRRAGLRVDGAVGEGINVVLAPPELRQLTALVRARDPKIRGVAGALIESGQGTPVSLAEARSGDVLQLWRIGDDGRARGHSGIVASVDAPGGAVVLLSAHNPQDGVGEKRFVLGAGGWPIYFLARPAIPRGPPARQR